MLGSVCTRPVASTDYSEVAAGYSELSGVLAGFAFVGITSVLVAHTRSERKDAALLYSLAPMTAVFIGLVFVSLNYGVLVGEDGMTRRIAASSVFAGLGFASVGILLPYVVQILIHAAGAGETPERKRLITHATVVLKLVTVLGAPLFALLLAVAVQDYIDLDVRYKEIHCIDLPPFKISLWIAGLLLLNGIGAWASLGTMKRSPRSAISWVPQWFRGRGPTIAIALAVSAICIGVACTLMIRWTFLRPVHADYSVPLLVWSAHLYTVLAAVTTWAALTYDVDAAEQRKEGLGRAPAKSVPLSITDKVDAAGPPNPGTESTTEHPPRLLLMRPLSKDELDRRTVDVFPQAYLTNISIIQGVGLGFLATNVADALRGPEETWWILAPQAAVMFAGLLAVSYQYMYFTMVVRWTPTFRDVLIPFLLGASEFIPMLLLGPDDTAAWWFAVAGFALAGAIAYLNTVRRLTHFGGITPSALGRAEQQLRRLLSTLCGMSVATALGCVCVGIAVLQWPTLSEVIFPIAGGVVLVFSIGGMVLSSERTLDAIHREFGVPRHTMFRHMPGWPTARGRLRDSDQP